MEIKIDIQHNLQAQFAQQFQLNKSGNYYPMNPEIGEGKGLHFVEFPGGLELYHFGPTLFKNPIKMSSFNPPNTQWFVLHINLSKVKQEKEVAGNAFSFQKHLPIGILLYGPGLEINTLIPPQINSELATLRFNRRFLEAYFGKTEKVLNLNKSLVYEDLDIELENILQKALNQLSNKLECHALALQFLKIFFDKLSLHSQKPASKKLHPDDYKALMLAASYLRNPLAKEIPSIEGLSEIANMGTSKFKALFKQVFGHSPMHYRNKIRMEFAKSQILAGKRPSELSHLLDYAHPSNFTLAYKKYFGKLPSEQA